MIKNFKDKIAKAWLSNVISRPEVTIILTQGTQEKYAYRFSRGFIFYKRTKGLRPPPNFLRVLRGDQLLTFPSISV